MYVILPLEQGAQTLPHNRVVVDDKDSNNSFRHEQNRN
jgi:hypothetical protein